jgi:hypothetical protein
VCAGADPAGAAFHPHDYADPELAILAAYALLVTVDALRGRLLLGVIRDWFPLALMLLAYREMGWFAPARHTPHRENSWIVWGRLVYTLGPFAVAMLYVYKHRERVERFLFPFILGVLPPRTVFPGQDFPSDLTAFRRFNWWMLGGYGIHPVSSPART